MKEFKGTAGDVSAIQLQLKKMELKIALERRSSFGSGLQRISADPELRTAFNAIVRGELGKKSDKISLNSDQKQAWEAHTKALAEGSSPGSTYINDELHTEIYSTIAEHGVWNAFDVIPAGTKTTKLIVDSTDPVMGAVAENTDPGEGSYTGASVSATVKKLLGWLSVSNELLEDSEIDLTSHILMKYARATALRLDTFCLSADGTDDATNGAMTGIFEGGTAVGAATGNVNTATLDFEDAGVVLDVGEGFLDRLIQSGYLHPGLAGQQHAEAGGQSRLVHLAVAHGPHGFAVGHFVSIEADGILPLHQAEGVGLEGGQNFRVLGQKRVFGQCDGRVGHLPTPDPSIRILVLQGNPVIADAAEVLLDDLEGDLLILPFPGGHQTEKLGLGRAGSLVFPAFPGQCSDQCIGGPGDHCVRLGAVVGCGRAQGAEGVQL